MASIERSRPHNTEAEEAVLGSLIIDNNAIFDVAPFLRPQAFYREQNRWIYEAILELNNRRTSVDLITLTEELSRREQLEEIGGQSTIIGLMNAVPTSSNAEYYAHIIEAAALRRQYLDSASSIANLAYNQDLDIVEVADRAEQELFSIRLQRQTRELVPISDVADAYLKRLDELSMRGDDLVGVTTGFRDLDGLLHGLMRSDLIIVAARPSMGKTSLQLSIALSAAKQGKRVAIFSLEMSASQLFQRLLSSETQIDSQKLRRGKISESEWVVTYEAAGRLSSARIFIDDTPGATPMQVRTKARRLHMEHGLDLVVVDYLQLMEGESSQRNRVQEVSEISRSLKGLARELDVPVLVASQLSRAVENRQDQRPKLSDLRDSGSIEQDADIVMFIYRDEMVNKESTHKNIAEIDVRKNRNGPTAKIDLYWHASLATFRNLKSQPVEL